MAEQKKRNPGALAGATGADRKAGQLLPKLSAASAKRKGFAAQGAWKKRNPEKVWAHAALRSGLRHGLLQKQPCERCGAEDAEAHHDDYDRPLSVRWLCRKHHKQIHARRPR